MTIPPEQKGRIITERDNLIEIIKERRGNIVREGYSTFIDIRVSGVQTKRGKEPSVLEQQLTAFLALTATTPFYQGYVAEIFLSSFDIGLPPQYGLICLDNRLGGIDDNRLRAFDPSSAQKLEQAWYEDLQKGLQKERDRLESYKNWSHYQNRADEGVDGKQMLYEIQQRPKDITRCNKRIKEIEQKLSEWDQAMKAHYRGVT